MKRKSLLLVRNNEFSRTVTGPNVAGFLPNRHVRSIVVIGTKRLQTYVPWYCQQGMGTRENSGPMSRNGSRASGVETWLTQLGRESGIRSTSGIY